MIYQRNQHMVFGIFLRAEQPPPPPPPIVINRYSDNQLRSIAKQMRERQAMYMEKVVDQYASSPEITPPVSEYNLSFTRLGGPRVELLCSPNQR